MTVTDITAKRDGYDRTPPHDIGAEQCTLGGMLQSRDAIADVAEIIQAKDHYRPAHQLIHEAILELDEAGDPVDAVTVGALLTRRGQFTQTGGGAYLHTLLASVPTAANAGYYARIVREKAILRSVIEAGTSMVQAAYAGGVEAAGIAEQARQIIDTAAAPPRETGLRTMDSLLASVLDSLERETDRGLPTGFADLDTVIAGLAPGAMVIVAARPGVGKSLLVTGIAAHNAIRHGRRVLMESLEMSAEEITMRLISAAARVPLHAMTNRYLTQADWDAIARHHDRIASAPLVIDDNTGCTLANIRGRLRAMAKTQPAELLVVDYLGLMSGPRGENRQAEVAALSRGLKLIARDFSIPVVVAAQLNRGPEHRSSKRPEMADLRESGAQEQDADVIILLHREDAYNRETPRAGEIDFIVDKNRQGPKATVTAAFQGHYARIVDMAPPPRPEEGGA